MIVNVGNKQIIGSREEQQDNFGISEFSPGKDIPAKGVLAIVADGMGGLQGGTQASLIAVRTALDVFAEYSGNQNSRDLLKSAFKKSDDQLKNFAIELNAEGNCGTTGVAVLINLNGLHWISVGDSRIYLLRKKILTCLTQDHNHALELWNDYRAGNLSLDIPKTDPEASHLISFLGGGLKFIDQNLFTMPLENGDRILLCSDGLFGTLSKDIIKELASIDPVTLSVELLLDTVSKEKKQHQDNATAVLLEIQDPPTYDAEIKLLKEQLETTSTKSKEPVARRTLQEAKPLSEITKTSSSELQSPPENQLEEKGFSFPVWLVSMIFIFLLIIIGLTLTFLFLDMGIKQHHVTMPSLDNDSTSDNVTCEKEDNNSCEN